jgi:ATP-dependent protease ClpP protease subunit
MGGVTSDNYLKITTAIKDLLGAKSRETINLIITSPGGPTGVAMSFYDLMRRVYRPVLRTIGAGDVDSAGIVLFLTGTTRFLTPHTTLLLHLAGRTFDSPRRFSTADMASILTEDQLKDNQYAAILAEQSGGRLETAQVLEMMTRNTVLSADEAVAYGLAHDILP